MKQQFRAVRNPLLALLIICAFLVQGTWALAGTTGSLSGTLTDSSNSTPIADATISVSSPSQQASAKTDSSGHFSFISLAPDTYSVSAAKDGYQPESIAGVSIFADNTQVIALKTTKALKNIAKVSARAAGALVKPGTTSDIYSVNAATQEAVQSIGGGGNLNSAYSAIGTVPGVQAGIGGSGWGQTIYIRGSEYNQVGYEYDGVPVNRAFDNYGATTLSNLGQQELQVYTGGSPAGASAATVGGFINQVIKTGTYPGFGTINAGIGAPIFYHNLKVEAGGASPNRLFSWYAGLGGYNQEFRLANNSDFGNVSTDGNNPNGLTGLGQSGQIGFFTNFFTQGPFPTCVNGLAPAGAPTFEATGSPACLGYASYAYNQQGNIADREGVINLHFGLPHKKDGGRDDVQLLYSGSALHTTFNDSINDLGGVGTLDHAFANFGGATGIASQFGITNYVGQGGPHDNFCAGAAVLNAFGILPSQCASSGGSVVPYFDGYTFGTGTSFGESAVGLKGQTYYFPSSPTNRAQFSGIDPAKRSGIWNDSETVKVQYQKNIGSNAYLRLFGYTFYSDWLMNSPNFGTLGYGVLVGGSPNGVVATDYELATHTRGAELQFADQLNPKNLLKLTANYTTAAVSRTYNSGSWRTATGAFQNATNLTNGDPNNPVCYNYKTGAAASCLSGSTSGTYTDPTNAATCAGLALLGTPCASTPTGASYLVTVPGGRGTYNTVRPVFTSAALEDEFKPTDRLDLTLGLRYENFQYNLTNTNSPEYNFWFNVAANSYCYDPTTGQPILNKLAPGQAPPAAPVFTAPGAICPATPEGPPGLHPNGQNGAVLFTSIARNQINDSVISPRVGLTYTVNPDTVVRASYGKYASPSETASTQYLDLSAKQATAFDFTHFFGLGFNTPVHNVPAQVSNNYDFSLEKHLRGTDLTFRLSPFYRYTTNQAQTELLGPNFAGSLNIGTQRSYGLEFQAQKGDPQRNGLSGLLSYTYTNAKVKYSNYSNGTNTIDTLNNYIGYYNKLTGAGGGATCYTPNATPGSIGAPDPSCTNPADVKNPYFANSPQPLLDRSGWYETYPNESPGDPQAFETTVLAPSVFSGFVQYKQNKLAIAPNFVLQAGGKYGSPTSVVGYDPRYCANNQSKIPGSTTSLNADYQSCFASQSTAGGNLAIPDPFTGRFDSVAQYRQPWQLNIGAQISYEITPKVKGTLILTNLVNRCFGGDKPAWAQAFPPNNYVCGYGPNGQYISNFYNGNSPSDAVNGTSGYPKVYNYPYAPFNPLVNASGSAIPFSAYLNFQIKL
ncbi:MAG: TonB-dependent receptor [Candidatus Eremiobacteraeota bacterium]|nr:TonB-dependent receptor [Candidatus Eremiobacteraeota bacterium]